MANIAILSPFLWNDKMPANSKEMAVSLSKNHKVVYVNFSLDIKSLLVKRKTDGVQRRLQKRNSRELVNNNLSVYYPKNTLLSINWIQWGGLYRLLNRINNYLFAKDIKRALDFFDNEPYVVLIDNMIARCEHLHKHLNASELWYYSRDFLFTQDYFKAHQEKQEIHLIQHCDKVFANSQVLQERAKQWNKNSYYLPQGISNTSNQNTNTQIDQSIYPPLFDFLADPSNVKLCFYGIVTSFRLDVELLHRILEKHPEYDILIIGRDEENILEALHFYPNFFHQPWLQPDEIKSVLPMVDILINPQLKNDYTNANSPRKILEYLSFGKPVIVTETDFIKHQNPPVHIANTYEEFVAQVQYCMGQPKVSELSEQRIQYSKKYEWDSVINMFDDHWPT